MHNYLFGYAAFFIFSKYKNLGTSNKIIEQRDYVYSVSDKEASLVNSIKY
ncbi:hypothetical protein UT300005_19940 [Clostridium sp. CTA-5]